MFSIDLTPSLRRLFRTPGKLLRIIIMMRPAHTQDPPRLCNLRATTSSRRFPIGSSTSPPNLRSTTPGTQVCKSGERVHLLVNKPVHILLGQSAINVALLASPYRGGRTVSTRIVDRQGCGARRYYDESESSPISSVITSSRLRSSTRPDT